MLSLHSLTVEVKNVIERIVGFSIEQERAKAVATYLATAVDREAEDMSTLCRWNATAEKMQEHSVDRRCRWFGIIVK